MARPTRVALCGSTTGSKKPWRISRRKWRELQEFYPKLKDHPDIRSEIEREVNKSVDEIRAYKNSPTATDLARAYGTLAKRLDDFLETLEAIQQHGFIGDPRDYRAYLKKNDSPRRRRTTFPDAGKADGYTDTLHSFFERINERLNKRDVLRVIRELSDDLKNEIWKETRTDSFEPPFWADLMAQIAKLFRDRELPIALGSHVDEEAQQSPFLLFIAQLERTFPSILLDQRAPSKTRRALADALGRALKTSFARHRFPKN